MRFLPLFVCVALLGFASLSAQAADTPKPLSDAEKAQIEDVIREFLVKKEPETIAKAVQQLQKKDEGARAEKTKSGLTQNKDKIYNDPMSPVGGNPKGDVTIVEFFDYQCGYCKMAQEATVKLLAEDKNVRFVYKEFPILGPNSTLASKAALAIFKDDKSKYTKFHQALMGKKEHLSAEIIDQVAKDVGVDVTKMHKTMEDAEVAKMLQDNIALGAAIGANGTPLFIINDKALPGAVGLDVLKQYVDEQRKSKK